MGGAGNSSRSQRHPREEVNLLSSEMKRSSFAGLFPRKDIAFPLSFTHLRFQHFPGDAEGNRYLG